MWNTELCSSENPTRLNNWRNNPITLTDHGPILKERNLFTTATLLKPASESFSETGFPESSDYYSDLLDEEEKRKDEVRCLTKQTGMLHNRANSLKRICQIDMSAFASIMFVLVFTMMVAEIAASPPHGGAGLDLPRVEHPMGMWRAEREDALIVGISRDGKVFFRDEMVARDDLPSKIKARLSRGSERKVYIRADAHVGYGRVGVVLDGVRSSGVENIAVLVEQRTVPVLGCR